MRSYGRAYARGAYTWRNTRVKEKVGLSTGGLYAEKYGINKTNENVLALGLKFEPFVPSFPTTLKTFYDDLLRYVGKSKLI